jgi:hypothetical protein
VDAKTRTTLRRLVDDRRRQELLARGYRKTAESLPSSCYDTAAGDPLLALWYAVVGTMIKQGSLPGSRPLRFKRAPARVVDARNENHDRDADVERGRAPSLSAAGVTDARLEEHSSAPLVLAP